MGTLSDITPEEAHLLSTSLAYLSRGVPDCKQDVQALLARVADCMIPKAWADQFPSKPADESMSYTFRQQKDALDEWWKKTDWVQEDFQKGKFSGSLGLHRADVLRAYILELERQVDTLKQAAISPTLVASWCSALHYPKHWDTAAYPTLWDAVHEIVTTTGCSECAPKPEVVAVLCSDGTLEHKGFLTPESEALQIPLQVAKPLQIKVDYSVIHKYSIDYRLNYNQLCAMVRSAVSIQGQVVADTPHELKWAGPHNSAAEALDATRRAVAETIKADPETWPSHGNAPLAIVAAVALRQAELDALPKQGG